MQSILNESDSDAWQHIAPLLDEALNCLGTKEHDAVVLRFFDGKELKQVGAAMGTTEDGARMRVNRGLEKLRKFFTKRGITLSAAVIAGAVSTYSVQAAPVSLARSVAAMAVTKGAAVSSSVLTLVKGALKLMAWAKAKTAVVVGVWILLASGTAIVAVKAITTPDPLPEKIWDLYSQAMADERPGIAVIQVMTDHQPMAAIRLSQLKNPAASGGMGSRRGRPMGIESRQGHLSMGVKLKAVLSYAYGAVPISGHGPGFPHNRIIVPADLAEASYDFFDTMPQGGGREVLRRALKDQFGLVARREMHDNLVLTVKNPAATGLHKHTDGSNMTMVEVANKLSEMLGVEVMDQTGLAGGFDFHLNLPRPSTTDGIKRAILDQLGLGLTPSADKQQVEFLVTERVR